MRKSQFLTIILLNLVSLSAHAEFDRADHMSGQDVDNLTKRMQGVVERSVLPPVQECENCDHPEQPVPAPAPVKNVPRKKPIIINDERIIALDKGFPHRCGYEWDPKDIPASVVDHNCHALLDIVEGKPLPHKDCKTNKDSRRISNPSGGDLANINRLFTSADCNIATIMGMLYLMRSQAEKAGPQSREMVRWNEIKNDFRCPGTYTDEYGNVKRRGKGYEIFIGYKGIENIAKTYNMPNLTKIDKSELDYQASLKEQGFPKSGDILLVQRIEIPKDYNHEKAIEAGLVPQELLGHPEYQSGDIESIKALATKLNIAPERLEVSKEHPEYRNPNRSNSGHAQVFSHYETDDHGKVTGICSWGAFQERKGLGVYCESLKYVRYLQSATPKL